MARVPGYRAALAGDTKYPPQDGQPALKQAIQRKFRRDSGLDFALNEITVGNGGKGVIFNALMATVDEGDEVVIPAPYWGAYPLMTRVVGGEPVVVNCPQNNGFKLRPEDLDAAITPRTKWLILNSPNNPTGAMMARESIERVVNEATGVVFIDEAYAEFAGVSAVDLAERSDRVLVIRTMSKAFGLAGLRIGYAIGQPKLVMEVEKSRGPYKLNAMAEQMAIAALRHDRDWIDEHVALAIQLRERLADALRAMGLSPMPSSANFVCVPVANCVAVGQALRARGVAVRPFPTLPHVGDALRISVGPWSMLQRLLDALAPAIAEVNG